MTTISKVDRILNRVRVTDDGCWEWQGPRLPKGYGKIKYQVSGVKYTRYTHRMMYEIAYGEIPKGLQIDHLCENKPCCNPDHLEVVTPRENILRGNSIIAQNARKTRCPRGHEYDLKQKNGRACSKCFRRKRVFEAIERQKNVIERAKEQITAYEDELKAL